MILFLGSENDYHLNGMIFAFCYVDSRVVGFLSGLNALVDFFESVMTSMETGMVALGVEVQQYHEAMNSRNKSTCRYQNVTAHSEVDCWKYLACKSFLGPRWSDEKLAGSEKSIAFFF